MRSDYKLYANHKKWLCVILNSNFNNIIKCLCKEKEAERKYTRPLLLCFTHGTVGFVFLSSFEYSKLLTFPLIGCTLSRMKMQIIKVIAFFFKRSLYSQPLLRFFFFLKSVWFLSQHLWTAVLRVPLFIFILLLHCSQANFWSVQPAERMRTDEMINLNGWMDESSCLVRRYGHLVYQLSNFQISSTCLELSPPACLLLSSPFLDLEACYRMHAV